jgi:hypothetical protein
MSDPRLPPASQLVMQTSEAPPANDTAIQSQSTAQPTPQLYPGLPVEGYATVQPQSAIDLVNRHKVHEEQVLRWIDELMAPNAEFKADQRGLAVARTQLQGAYMWLNRAIFQPQRVPLNPTPADFNAGVPIIEE